MNQIDTAAKQMRLLGGCVFCQSTSSSSMARATV